ncbi:hypothetical protein OG520_12500 [Streptomyces sp. NBC_00984]|uniref:hypothetical protein n=1 Tax=Streptomyces sp. NBC_00984 TaxID=2903700 RepID=UPI003864091D|nr:hypothetical protein OG520_12500 [Streptomyces sp. NBC_00984]
MLGPLREDSPRRIGPYAIRARLGAGGMGEVFLGARDGGGDPVAVKTVRRDVSKDPGFRSRFRREITVARSVAGPHLAPLLDDVPDALRAVLDRCLVADPAARPTAAGLAELLDPGAAQRWPDPVAQHIAEHGRELARVMALDGPLLPGYTPAEATADSRPAPHHHPPREPTSPRGCTSPPPRGPASPHPGAAPGAHGAPPSPR